MSAGAAPAAVRVPAFGKRSLLYGLPVVAALGTGVGVGLDSIWPVVAVTVPAGLILGLVDWRLSILGLLAFLPFSGLVILGFNDPDAPFLERAVATLLKDLVFVLPAYLGFALQIRRQRRVPSIPRTLLIAMAAFAAIVLVQAARTFSDHPSVTVIGLKVWLLYLPLVFLGVALVRDTQDLRRALSLMALVAVPPTVVGLVEAGFIYSGHRQAVYDFYGTTARAATQSFVGAPIGLGGRLVYRIPSTFTFFVQYFAFLIAMVAVVWGLWRSGLSGLLRSWRGPVLLGLLILAALTSGSRNAFASIPFVLLLAFVLERRPNLRRLRTSAILAVAGLAAVAVLLAAGPLQPVAQHAYGSVNEVLVDGLDEAWSRPGVIVGQGPGVNTPAARYVSKAVGRDYIDSWIVKAAVELGVGGLLVLLGLLGAVLWHVVRAHRQVLDPLVVPVSAALTALILWTALNSVKGFYLDLDPLSVYFWLFVGLVLALPRLGASEDRPGAPEAGTGQARRLAP